MTDPILALERTYREIEAAGNRLAKMSGAIRAHLIARYGHPTTINPACDLWGDDPRYDELTRVNQECDALTAQICVVTDAMVATPATTVAGIVAKLQVAVGLLPKQTGDYYEDVAAAAMKDAVRLLAEDAARRA